MEGTDAEAQFIADAELISLVYHMHDRGKDEETQLSSRTD